MTIKDIAIKYIDDMITTGSWKDWRSMARDCREENVRQWLLEATSPERKGIGLEHRYCYARWHRFARTVQLGWINAHAIRLFIERVRKSYDVQSVVMYGSRARGDHRPGSDINLAVIVSSQVCSESSDDKTVLETAAAVQNDLECRCALISPVLIRQPEWTGEAEHSSPALIDNIRKDGITLFQANNNQ